MVEPGFVLPAIFFRLDPRNFMSRVFAQNFNGFKSLANQWNIFGVNSLYAKRSAVTRTGLRMSDAHSEHLCIYRRSYLK